MVEALDYIFHRIIPDRVISPTLDPSLISKNGKFARIAPIARKQYKSELITGRVKKIVIMLSGSVFGSPVEITGENYSFQIDIVGRAAPAEYVTKKYVRYHNKVKDNSSLLLDADLMIVNGGFSAISEAFCMRKPMVVIPVPKHAEQWVNAKTVEKLGIGSISSEQNLEQAMNLAIDRIDEFRAAYRSIGDIGNGADQAASEILSMAES